MKRLNFLAAIALTLGIVVISTQERTTSAQGCAGDSIYYSSMDNSVHVVRSATCTLTDIYARAFLAEPLELVDAENKIWYLKADLYVEYGATLNLHGDSSGGDVNELRLKSANDDSEHAFIEVVADYGTIDIRDTRIQSFDPNTGEPDTNYDNGRANIRAMSHLDRWNTPHESTMNVINSDISYLGYLSGESYGMSWKVKDKGDLSTLDFVGVYGTVQNSVFHHNYYGAYSYGAEGMQWLNNEFHSNDEYGLDPHDDSDNLLIEGNFAHDNGNHGIICSKRCDNLTIRNNTSSNNDGHGIMLHRQVEDSVVEGNVTEGNTLAGIAIFDSHNNIVRNNTSTGNEIGVRIWLGSSGNEFSNNVFSESNQAGIYLHQGSDEPSINDGRPNNNRFIENVISANEQAIKLKEADHNSFTDNQITDNTKGAQIYSLQPSGNLFDGNTFANNGTYSLKLESTTNTRVTGNTFSETNTSLQLIQNTTATIENNTFTDGRVGVDINTQSAANTIANNTFTNSGVGLSITTQSNANVIEGNHFWANEYAVQITESAYTVLRGNLLTDNAENYIHLREIAPNTRIEDTAHAAVRIDDEASSALIVSTSHQVIQNGFNLPTIFHKAESSLEVTSAIASSPATFTLLNLQATATHYPFVMRPAAWETNYAGIRQWYILVTQETDVAFVIGDLAAQTDYGVLVNGVYWRDLTTTPEGTLSFEHPEYPDTAQHYFEVAPKQLVESQVP